MLKQKLSLQNKEFWVEAVKVEDGPGSQGGTEMLRCGTRMGRVTESYWTGFLTSRVKAVCELSCLASGRDES